MKELEQKDKWQQVGAIEVGTWDVGRGIMRRRRREKQEEEEEQEEEREPTSIPSDRPLRPHEAALLSEPAVSVACLRPGDLLAFSSAALHFATNGAAGLSAALYHGMVTEASLPRLQLQAMAEGDADGHAGGSGPLSAADIVRSIRERTES